MIQEQGNHFNILEMRAIMSALMAGNISGKQNLAVDQSNFNNQLIAVEWSLLSRVFKEICRVYRSPW